MLSSIVRDYLFESDTSTESRILFDLVFLVFAFLMTRVARVRNQLELRVAERTAELTELNDNLKREIVKHHQVEAELRLSEAYLAEAQRLSHTGSWAWSPPRATSGTGPRNVTACKALTRKGGYPDMKSSFKAFIRTIKPELRK